MLSQLGAATRARRGEVMAFIALTLIVVPSAFGASITWTGISGDNQWTNAVNWYPDTVPTMNDDVTIPNGTVYITIPTGVSSLLMGTEYSSPAYVTVYNQFTVGAGGLHVQGNGFLYLSASASSLAGSVVVDGSFVFSSGALSGAQVTIGSTGTADLGGAAAKSIADGSTLLATGTSFLVGGTLTFEQQSQLKVTTTISFTASTLIQGPVGSLDLSSAVTYCSTTVTMMTSVSFGAMNLSSTCSVVVESGNVTFDEALGLPAGASIITSGVGNIALSSGVSGAGSLSITGGSLTVGGSEASSVSAVTVSGGHLVVISPSLKVANLALRSGSVSTPGGSSSVAAAVVSFTTGGITVDGTVSASSSASLSGVVTFSERGSLVVPLGATLWTLGATTLTGNPGPSVTVAGVFNATSAVKFNNIGLIGDGSVNIGDGATVNIVQGRIAQQQVFLAPNAVFAGDYSTISGLAHVVPAGSKVKGTIGAYSFTCPGGCNRLSTTKEPTSSFTFVSVD